MPQIMIDTAAETPATLRHIAATLAFLADQMSGTVPAGTVAEVINKWAPAVETLPVLEQHDPAKVFGHDSAALARINAGGLGQGVTSFEALQPSNVVPLVPLPPAAPNAGCAAELQVAVQKTGAVSTAVDTDGAGLPWDARIHSGTPTKNANGLWRMRRGVDNATIEAVEAELRTNYPKTVTVPVVVPSPPIAPTAPAASVTLPVGSPTAPVAPGVQPGNEAFRVMMDKYSKEMGVNGRLNKTVMAPIFSRLGVASWTDFFKRPELIPSIAAEAERLLA